jgi:predicted P-loop ATPase
MRHLPVSVFAHTRDNAPSPRVLNFPDDLDDFREADARVFRPFLDTDRRGNPVKQPGKDGPLWSPARFNGARAKANVVSVCALVLDYDYGDLDADVVVARWEKYEHVIHSTYTLGRWRVVLPYAAPITPAEHDRVYAWALAREAGYLDGSTSDASRIFYLPTCRTDLDVDPVFGYTLGELLDPALIGLDLPRVPRSSGSPSRNQSPPTPALEGAVGHGRGAADSPYAGIESVDQREDLALIESRCRFMAHVRADAATLPQPEWYAALSIIGRCRGGDDLAHAISAPYPGYDEAETEETYQRAKTSAGPRTCADIRRLVGPTGACAACPLQITSPVLLGRNAAAPAPAPAADVEEVDLFAAVRDAEARQQEARLAEDAAILRVENARRHLTSLRRVGAVASEDDVAAGVAALGAAKEAVRLAERVRASRERDTAAAKKRTSVEGLPPGADPAVWQRLRMGREGTPSNTTANLLTVLDDDPRWSSRLTYDAFSLDVCLDGVPLPEDRATRLVGKLGHDYALDTTTTALLECVRAVAVARQFHPVQQWLASLTWDGASRVDGLMLQGFGALPRNDADLVRTIGAKFLVSLVARAMKPGAQVDTMLVLTGKQGMHKSSSFRALVGDAWFADTKMDLANKDSFINLSGKWLVEFGEMAAVRKVDDNTGKGWLTSRVDRYRAPYAKRAEDHPRQSVACGTANGEDYEFLQDPTGWRRYWPMTVARADIAWIVEHREQLFAEAVVMYGAGFKWWFDEGSDEAERLKAFVAPYVPTHPWTEAVAGWLQATVNDRNLEVFTSATVLNRALGMQVVDIKKSDQTDVGNILREVGCDRVDRSYENGHYVTRYRRPERMLMARTKGVMVNIFSREPARA